MEALGRTIAVILGTTGTVLLLFFYKTAPVRWQRNETVHSMCHAYAECILSERVVTPDGWELFQKEINRLGTYRAELSVYERKRYEGQNGRIYLFTKGTEPEEEQYLSEGSYIRLVITEETKGKLEPFFYGPACTVIAGGRVE